MELRPHMFGDFSFLFQSPSAGDYPAFARIVDIDEEDGRIKLRRRITPVSSVSECNDGYAYGGVQLQYFTHLYKAIESPRKGGRVARELRCGNYECGSVCTLIKFGADPVDDRS